MIQGLLSEAKADWEGSFRSLPSQVAVEAHLTYFSHHRLEALKLITMFEGMLDAGYVLFMSEVSGFAYEPLAAVGCHVSCAADSGLGGPASNF